MTIVNDILADRLSRLAIAYGRHVVKGFTTKHVNDATGPSATWQQAVGQASFYDAIANRFRCGGWGDVEKLYYQGFEIDAADYHFHSGGAADAPDAFFPGDIPHPMASYYSARLTTALAAQIARDDITPDQMIGIFKTLKVADYNEDGEQIDDLGAVLPGGSDPDNFLYYSASPAREIMDLRRRARRSLLHVNYPSYVAWRDYCAEEIDWDDGALTPHQISLAASAGGSLAPGTYWVRVATLKSGDISSASKDRATDGVSTASVVISGGNLRFTVTWATQVDRGATGYRIYIGTAEGAEDRYFVVGSGATNTLLVTTLTGATMGSPPELATGALLRQIPRFESHVFFPPPFDLSTAMDRIAQITCLDWQYANGKLLFLTPEVRDPVFTLNLSEATNFKTYQVDRRSKPNQIIVSYRDLDSPYLAQADPPVTIDRPTLQAREGVRPFEINGGCMYRSQAERVGHYWARRLIDSDQMLEIFGSPRTYIVLPGDPINVTHDVPNWTDVEFYVEEKEEQEDTKAGYQMTSRVYGAWYSDTDHSPLPRPLPLTNPSAFTAPPVVTTLTLTQRDTNSLSGLVANLHGAVQFAAYVGQQRGRVFWWRPDDVGYHATDVILVPDPTTLQAAFEFPAVASGLHKIVVVTESELGVSQTFGAHPEETLTIVIPDGPLPTDFECFFDAGGTEDAVLEWAGDGLAGEVFDLRFTESDFTTVLRGPIEVRPQSLQQPVPWSVPGFTPNATISLIPPGGLDILVTGTAGSSSNFSFQSQNSARRVGGVLFRFQVPIDKVIPTAIGLANGSISLLWTRDLLLSAPNPDGSIFTTEYTIYADGQAVYGVVPGDEFGILIREDFVAEFHLNPHGGTSQPLYVSPKEIDPSLPMTVVMEDINDTLTVLLTQTVGIRNASWVRSDPAWRYIADAQAADGLALTSGEHIYAQVRQRSRYANGQPSAWVNEDFTRP